MVEQQYFVWSINDAQLNNACVISEFVSDFTFDSSDTLDDLLRWLALEKYAVKPFLDRYGLILKLLDRSKNDELITLPNIAFSPEDLFELEVPEILPPYKYFTEFWLETYPWMRFQSECLSDTPKEFREIKNMYPYYWDYSRKIRKTYLNEENSGVTTT